MESLKNVMVAAVVCLSLACSSLGNSEIVTRRCCAGGDDCPEAATGDNPPPISTSREINVTWETQDLRCAPTETEVYYDIGNDTSNVIFLPKDELENDELMLQYELRMLFYVYTTQFCLENHGGRYRAKVCQPDPEKVCGDGTTCIPKCCGVGEMIKDFQCVSGTGNMSLPFHSFAGKSIPAPTNLEMVGYMVPECKDGEFPGFREDTSNIQLLVNGKLLERDAESTYDVHNYCIDDMYLDEHYIQLFLKCSEHESTTMVVKHSLQKIGYVISAIFLVITILFHIFIPSLRDTQGLCLVSHMVAMLLADILLFVLSMAAFRLPLGLCIFNGFLFHFSFLAMFFWLNIMCFDVWRVIRNTARGIPLRGILDNDEKKFRLYCLYGWGCPLVVVVVAAIMHTLPEQEGEIIIRPGFGKETCWITGDDELLVYCYGFVIALFVLDLAFLGHAMFMLFEAGNTCSCFKRQVSITAFNRKHLEAFWQRFSLFILMVLVWTTEVLSWKIPPRELWILSDFVNSLQGFLVFIIFISSKKKRDLVRGLLKKIPLPCFESLREASPPTSTQTGATYKASVSKSDPSTSEEEISRQQESISRTNSGE